MATTPPEQPTTPAGPAPPSYATTWPPGARMPIPGNAEFAVWLVVVIVVAIIWAASDRVEADGFVISLTVVTFGYLVSRGIAKASRVLEQ